VTRNLSVIALAVFGLFRLRPCRSCIYGKIIIPNRPDIRVIPEFSKVAIKISMTFDA
jgi:hypothetical protein